MLITDFAFEELNEGSGAGRIGADGQPSEFYRSFKIAWADMKGFLLALKGGWQKINANTFQHLTPDEHPDWPGCFCESVDYEPLGLSSQDAATKRSSWEYAKVKALYKPATHDIGSFDPSKIVEEEFDFSLVVQTVSKGSLLDAAGAEINQAVTLRIPTLTYVLSMPALPKLPGGNINTVMGLLGRMNDAVFGGAGIGFFVFLGMRASRKGASALSSPVVVGGNILDSGPTWQAQLKFEYRGDGHTWDEVCAGGKWTKAKFKDSGKPIVEAGNLKLLLP